MKPNPKKKKQAPGAAPQSAHMVSIDGAAKRSRLEILFLRGWEHQGGPELVEEFAFAEELAPGAYGAGRAWRADFCHVPTKTLIEIDGGTFSGGRHNRGSGAAGDYEKLLAAHLAGWRVVRLTGGQITALVIAALIKELAERGGQVSAGSREAAGDGFSPALADAEWFGPEPGWIDRVSI